MRTKTGRRAAIATLLAGLAGCAQPLTGVPPAAMGSVAQSVPVTVAERPNSVAREGCFAGQVGDKPWASRLAESTVHILEPSGKVGLKGGSGFVIRDSAEGSGKLNRLVTAGHVVDDVMGDDGLVSVADSSGHRIGYAAVVARIARNAGITADNKTLVRNDYAVLEMRAFFDGGKDYFTRIEGLDLGDALPGTELESLVSRPAGIVGGASGSPVVDADGRAIGIMVGSTTDSKIVDGDAMWSASVSFSAPDGSWNGDMLPQVGAMRKITLPARSFSYAETLADPTILAALGPAGQRAQTGKRTGWFKDVRIPGFATGACIVYHADMKPMGLPFE